MNKVTKTAIAGLLALFAGNAAATDGEIVFDGEIGNDSNLLIVFYVQIMPDDLVMQLHRF